MLLFSDGAGGFVDLAAGASQSSAIFRGQHAAADAPGPEPDPVAFVDASITTFTSPYGTELAPLGSGRWICVDAAASGGGNGQSWATAFDTISAAVTAATVPGDVIVIKNGTYREAVSFVKTGTEAAPYRMTRYGSHTPRITGSEVLTGWAACTDQADALGSPQWANCYKAFVPAGDVIGTTGDATAGQNGICLGLMQDQVKLRLAIDGPGFTDAGLTTAEKQDRGFNSKNTSWFYSATGATGGIVGGNIEITNTAAFGSRTEAELTHAYVAAHYSDGNNVNFAKITALDTGTDTVTCAHLYTSVTTYVGAVAIMNAGADLLLPGFWVFSDTLEGDGTRKVVVYPYDGVDLTSAGTIEYCKREYAVEMQNGAWMTLYGLDGDGVWGYGSYSGNCFGSNSHATSWKTGWKIEECSAQNITAERNTCTGFNITYSEKCSLINNTIREVEGAGMNLQGAATRLTKGLVHQNSVSRTFSSGIRPHSIRQGIVSYNEIFDIVSAHGNGMSIYGAPASLGCSDVLVFGNRIRTGYGIGLTFQDATNLWFICNDVATPPSTAGYRGIENNSSRLAYDPVAAGYITDGVVVVLNNTTGPATLSNGDTTGIISYKVGGTDHVNLNNVGHGMGDPMVWDTDRSGITWTPTGSAPKWLEFSNNVTTNDVALGTDYLTGRSYAAGTGPNYFDQYPAQANNVKNTTLAAVYTDVASGNYRPVASGPLDGTGLPPASSVNSAILFPDVTAWGFAAFDFDRDCDGNPLDWDAPPIGAYVVPT